MQEFIKEESIYDLAGTCHDVLAGRDVGKPYNFPGRSQQHKNELPDDRKSTPWPLWLAVAKTIQEWPADQLKASNAEHVLTVFYQAIREQTTGMSPDYIEHTRAHMTSVAEFAIYRAKILAPD